MGLRPLLKSTKIIISRKVYIESVERSKEMGYKDAYEIESYINKKKIEIKSAPKSKMEEYEEMFKIERGEGESLALASELKLPMICDDKRGINAARILNIKRVSAIIVLETLYKRKKINKKAALEALNKLIKNGWYKQEIIDSVKEEIEKC